MQLTKNFNLSEFTHSQTAARHNIDNTPTAQALQNLYRVAYTLEIIRSHVNKPIFISSGYRSPRLNRKIGGSKTSAHMRGLAADFVISGMSVAESIAVIEQVVGFDQLINEYGRWVHLGLSDNLRNQVFSIG